MKVVGLYLPSVTSMEAAMNPTPVELVTLTINPDRIAYTIEPDDIPEHLLSVSRKYPGFRLISLTGGKPEDGWLVKEA